MKQLVVLALALFTFTGFAQKMDREKMSNAIKERTMRKGKISPEKRAEIQTKKMALTLDLSENQQSQVESILLEHYQESEGKRNAMKKAKKDLSEDERHDIMTEKLDAQIALKGKMKNILNEEQYSKYSKMMDRRLQKGKGMRKGPKGKKG